MSTALELAKVRTNIQTVGKLLNPEWKPKSSCYCPYRVDKRECLGLYEGGARFWDFKADKGGDVIDFLAQAKNLSNRDACRELIQIDRALHGVGGYEFRSVPPRPAALERRHQNRKLPPLDEGKRAEHLQLAQLRNLCPEAIEIAIKQGNLRFWNSWEGRSWVLTDDDRQTVLARRLDGEVWQRVAGHPKACALSSLYWPIGWKAAVRRGRVVITEGTPDYLAALHFARLSNCENEVGIICLASAGSKIPKECLPFFAGLAVRIFVHNDASGKGLAAAKRWGKQLVSAGAHVWGLTFDGLMRSDGDPVEDLNDLTLVSAESWEQHRELIESVMLF